MIETQKKITKKKVLDGFSKCRHTSLSYDSETGETACRDCGLVLSIYQFSLESQLGFKSMKNNGQPSNLIPGKSLGTLMGIISSRKLAPSLRQKIQRLRKIQSNSATHSSKNKTQARVESELQRIAGNVCLPTSVKQEAAFICHKALKERLVQGRAVVRVAAAALYATCRENKIPRTLREISEASHLSKKVIARDYRLLLYKLNLRTPNHDPIKYLSKIAETTKISNMTKERAFKILMDAKNDRTIIGKNPIGLAAGALYLACKQNHEKKQQKQIAEVIGITDTTIRTCSKLLEHFAINGSEC